MNYVDRVSKNVKTFSNLWSKNRKYAIDKLLLELRRMKSQNTVKNVSILENEPGDDLLITHILSPFLLSQDSAWVRRHQGMWKPHEYVKIYNELGYNPDVVGRGGDLTIPKRCQYEVHFGSTPHFFDAAKSLPSNAVNIFYSTGNHWEYQDQMLKERIRMLENRKGVCIKNARFADYDLNLDIADYMIMMGDQHTQDIYTKCYKFPENKIYRVTNAGFDELNIDDNQVEVEANSESLTNFLWFAGGGPILKGLDLALEVFKNNEELDLYVCGDLNEYDEFIDTYRKELYETENIHFVGWVNIHSEKFKKLTKKCGFHLSPTCSDGISGAVINTMHRGVIPIVTDEAGIDVKEFGYIIDGSVNSVQRAVINASRLSLAELIRRAKRSRKIACLKYSKRKYKEDMRNAIHTIFQQEGL